MIQRILESKADCNWRQLANLTKLLSIDIADNLLLITLKRNVVNSLFIVEESVVKYFVELSNE
jgi:hypothetical protein